MDKTFKKLIIVVALLATIWGCIPADAKSEYKVSGKVITLVERKGAKSQPHDSITGYKLQTSKGTFEVFLCGFPAGESGAITNINMEKTLVVPGAPKDVIYVRAHGNSMVSTDPTQSIPDGAYVAIRKMRTGIVQWGEVYAIATSDGMILKRLMPCEADETRIRCVSNNGASYPPFDIPKSDIIDIAIVVGVLTVAWRTA